MRSGPASACSRSARRPQPSSSASASPNIPAVRACNGEKSPASSRIASTGQESDSVASFSRSNCPKRPASRAGDARPISTAVDSAFGWHKKTVKPRTPAWRAASRPSSWTSSRRAANSRPSAWLTAAGSSSLAAKRGGGMKYPRASGTVPRARSRSSSNACPQRRANPSRGSFSNSPMVEMPIFLKNPSESKPVTSKGNSSSLAPLPRARQSAARAAGATASCAVSSMASSPSRSRSRRCSSPPNSRRLPSTSRSKPCGGSSETLGVNWQAQAATCSSVPGDRQGRWRATQSMERTFQGHAQRRGGWRATALQNADGELALDRLERDAQAGGRRLARRFAGAEQRDQGAAGFGGDREAPQLRVAGGAKPRQQRMAGARAQRLFGGPQAVAAPGCPHHGQTGKIDTGGGERGCIRQVRRREPDHAPARGGQRSERGQQQPQLADPLLQAEDLGEPAGRPAAPRQLAVQDRKPAGDDGSTGKGCSAAPDGMPLEEVFEGHHHNCIFIQYYCRRQGGL